MAIVKIVTDTMQSPEVQKLAEWVAIDAFKRWWKSKTGRKPTPKDEKEIRQIVQATIADVHKYDPKVEAIELAVKRRNPITVRHKKTAVRVTTHRYSIAAKKRKAKRK